jgi:hypothetical protein
MHNDLTYIETNHRHLDGLHTATRNPGGGHAIHPAPPAPARVDVLDHQRDLWALLSSWTLLVAEDRHLSGDLPQSSPQAARWLHTHVEWLAASDFGDDAASELSEARRRLAGAIGDSPRGQRIGCACGGVLRVDLSDLDATVTCRQCGYATSTGMLLRLVVTGALEEAEPVDGDCIEHLLGIPRRTLDRWASAGRIRRDHGRYWYSEVVVEAATRRVGRGA